MRFSTSVKTCLKEKYAAFGGRAPRSEFWWFYLFFVLVQIVTNILDTVVFGTGRVVQSPGFWAYSSSGGVITLIATLALLVPALAVSVRRLHDNGKTGWLILLTLIPLIGGLILLFFFVQRSQAGPNAYGPDPLHQA
ncbi:membrane protein [Thioclava dalianensis]|uniref:Membrane protein n=1 Tax=Thioclava dalianensis TaxID=1185766 RepID=A0A074TQR2_9RHOB|nr:DUF805 domain-containing protein [Thioclava dalianensis]KEP71288.1 membrane protein [Thioclava dalianensis]SFM76530.1 Uncharacterized membrane protein YhaH, DUF805 family [Thioclava dalianensis]